MHIEILPRLGEQDLGDMVRAVGQPSKLRSSALHGCALSGRHRASANPPGGEGAAQVAPPLGDSHGLR